MSGSGRFWDRSAERYSKRPVADEASYQKKLAITREYFRPDMQVLEFGCKPRSLEDVFMQVTEGRVQ